MSAASTINSTPITNPRFNSTLPKNASPTTAQPQQHYGSVSWFVLKGISTTLCTPALWCYVICPLLVCIVVGVTCTVVLFALALYPQAMAWEDIVPTWAAWLIAVLLVFIESFLAIFIFILVIFSQIQDKLFMKVLKLRGIDLTQVNVPCHVECAAKILEVLFGIIIFVISLPLNCIPILGTVIFFLLDGILLSWELHANYMSTKGLRFPDQYAWIVERWRDYASFGALALFLDFIPLLNVILYWTNVVGAAEWASIMEKCGEGATIPGVPKVSVVSPEATGVELLPSPPSP